MSESAKDLVISQADTGHAVTPMTILEQSVNIDPERAAQLFELQIKWEANEARKAYNAAMSKFKAKPPRLEKTSHVKFGNTEYWHQDLGKSMDVINAALSLHDLSIGWRIHDEGDTIRVECVCSHIGGHSESTSMSAPPDTSGQKNSIQARASSVSYLQRYTANALLGLAAVAKDDDGATDGSTITENQAIKIRERLEAIGKKEGPFCKWLKVPNLESTPLTKYGVAIAELEHAEKVYAKNH